jgi:pimeloyl-ACP methyl ester carboxylesterase
LRKGWLVFALVAAIVSSACGAGGGQGAASRSFSLGGKPMVECYVAIATAAKCGALTVAENPSVPAGRSIDIAVRVVPASRADRLDPVFFLAGGPGGSAIQSWATAPKIFSGLTERHDIVLVDQRGTGLSHNVTLPDVAPGETLEAYAARALVNLDAEPRYYTTAVAMDDLDAVRAALGYAKIDLYGGSYGATAAQYYVRQHAEHVGAVVLDGATLLDVPVMELVARSSQQALDGVLNRCLLDSACRTAYPNVRSELATVLSRLEKTPVRTSVTDPKSGGEIVVTRDYFAGVIHNRMLAAGDAATIPWLIHQAWTGGFDEVAASASITLPTQLMSVEIRCSEAWARFDPAMVQRFGAGSYYLPAQLAAAQVQAAACALLPRGVVSADDSAPARTDAPVLLLNGLLDPQDPPSNVYRASDTMPHTVALAIPYQGHTVGHIGCLPEIVVKFLDTDRVDMATAQACIASISAPAFKV